VASRSNKNPSRSIIISVAANVTIVADYLALVRRGPVAGSLAALVVLLSLALLASGQTEDRRLVIGSVYRIVRNLVEVKEDGGDIAVIKVDAATTYFNSSTQAPAKLKDIAAGDQIVVRVIVKAGVDTAEQVKFVPALGTKKGS
jgi:hypothetical protein